MQSLNGDELKQVLGEVLLDELRVIREYVSVIPSIISRLDDMNDRQTVLERLSEVHEINITDLTARMAALESV